MKFNAFIFDQDIEFDFRDWNYVITKVKFSQIEKEDDICLNIDYDVTLIDRLWLKKLLFQIVIFHISSSLKIREIESSQHETSKYIIIFNYFSKVDEGGNKVLACIRRKIYIVDDLRVKMLIENDFIKFEEIIIDVIKKKAYISNYKTFITITSR